MTTAWRSLADRAQGGFAGYPIATIAFYGPDDELATKVAVAIVPSDDGEVRDVERWLVDIGDVRDDDTIGAAVLELVRASDARSIVMVDRILGCPHEEGVDYPEGTPCPRCPFWADRDRWAGLIAEHPVAGGGGTLRSASSVTHPTLVADLRHYLDDDGTLPHLPSSVLNLALHQGAIVEWMTMVLPGDEIVVTNVYCRRRPKRRRCRGQIHARFQDVDDAIEWACPVCGDNGVIYGWEGSRWDRGPSLLPDDDRQLN